MKNTWVLGIGLAPFSGGVFRWLLCLRVWSLGYKRLDEPLDVNANGIDAIYVTKEGKYVIVETKFSSSGRASLGKTLDGQQMSDSWLKGGSSRNRGSRIHEAVKHLRDENLAKKIWPCPR